MDEKKIMDHLMSHQKYPASKADLVAECDNLSDFSEKDKDWFKSTLPDGTYKSAQEVAMALGMKMTM